MLHRRDNGAKISPSLLWMGATMTAVTFLSVLSISMGQMVVALLMIVLGMLVFIFIWKDKRFPLTRQKKRKIPHCDRKDSYLSMDCEMVGVGPQGRKSALARVSIVNWDLEVIFDTYVQVMDRVTDYRTPVSGIRKKDLIGGMNFRLCRQRVESILRGKVIIGHGLENDFNALRYIHPPNMIRDTSQYRPLQRLGVESGKWQSRKLRDLVKEYLGNHTFQQGEHDSIHDAKAVMELYHLFYREWE